MVDKGLSLKELRVHVEATFDWPGNLDDTSPISIPEAADEIGRHLQAIERRLSPVPPQSEQQLQPAPSLLPHGSAAQPLETEDETEVDRGRALLDQRVVEPSATAPDLTEFFDRLQVLEERLSAVAAVDAQPAELPFQPPEPTSAANETHERPLSVSTNGRESDSGSHVSSGDQVEMIDILRGDTEPEQNALAGRFFKKKHRYDGID
ncbi:MAG TPA: hypothetical protein VMU99_06190 [Acidimicrobiales bacterium]|nr:hypothetical protein [Acidimicrobiales bacterium]